MTERTNRKEREEALELYDRAMNLRAGGKSGEAEKLLERIATKYERVVDVARRARALTARPPEGGKGKEIEPALPEPDLRVECPGCGDALTVDAQTLRVWCDVCEDYVTPSAGGKDEEG